MCWAHVSRAVDKKLPMIQRKDLCDTVRRDIEVLLLATNQKNFQRGSKLLIQHGIQQKVPTSFINYFKSQWLNHLPGWYEGVSPGKPSTNNGLENRSGIIKDANPLRSHLPRGVFLSVALSIAMERSENTANHRQFAADMQPGLQDLIEAYQWTVAKAMMIHRAELYTVASSVNTKVTTAQHQKALILAEPSATTFTEKWIVYALEHHCCTCPVGIKRGLCEHVLGILMSGRDVICPPATKALG